MAADPITAALDIGGKLIDRLWPNPVEAEKAKFELFKLQQSGQLAEITGQLAVNAEEAKNSSVFVSGWRPYVGWTCGVGLGYSFLLQPLLSWASTIFNIPTPPILDLSVLLTTLGGMLGLSGLRTQEKINGVARN